MTGAKRQRSLVRPHVVTGGRTQPTRNTLDHVTLVRVARRELGGLNPEQLSVMRLCQPGPLSVAEIAGYLRLPVSLAKVVISDLIDSGHVAQTAPALSTESATAHLLQEVLDGLRQLR